MSVEAKPIVISLNPVMPVRGRQHRSLYLALARQKTGADKNGAPTGAHDWELNKRFV